MSNPEADWKTLRKLHDVLLERLCARINQRSLEILTGELATENEKRMMMYHHIQESDEIIGHCFDDWRRSTISLRILALCNHQLLTPDELQRLSAPTREWIEDFASLKRAATPPRADVTAPITEVLKPETKRTH